MLETGLERWKDDTSPSWRRLRGWRAGWRLFDDGEQRRTRADGSDIRAGPDEPSWLLLAASYMRRRSTEFNRFWEPIDTRRGDKGCNDHESA